MDFARMAISRALQDQNMSAFLDKNCGPDMLPDMESKAVLAFMWEFFKKHRAVPSPTLVETQFAGYALPYAPDPSDYYVGKVMEQHARTLAADMLLRDGRKLLTDEPFKIIGEFRSAFSKMLAMGAEHREKTIEVNTDERWASYELRKTSVGVLGIPTGYDSLDTLTQGWQPEMYCGIAARPGIGKTWGVLKLALFAWQSGYDVLFCNKELPDEMMERRFDALLFKLAYERLRTGMLTTVEETRYKAGLEAMAKAQPAKWTWLHGASTVSAICAKVEEHSPDLVVIDGAYLLRDEDGGRQPWERYTNISRGIKRMCQDYKLPTIITIQLARTGDTKKNKTRVTQSDVMGSDAFAQDVDILIALDQTDTQQAMGEQVWLPLKCREAPPTPFTLRTDFETMETKDLGVTTTVVDSDSDSIDFD